MSAGTMPGKGKTMKIILDIPDGAICAFLNGVRYTNTRMEMFSYQLGSDDLVDGKETKLPREKEEQ